MLCPHCRHAHGLHSAPALDGRAADGALLAPDYIAGRCHQGDCRCPGWYPDTTDLELVAATLAARAERTAVAAAPPFTLTPEPATRTAHQSRLF